LKILLVNSERGMRGGEYQTAFLARGLAEKGGDVRLALRKGSELYHELNNEFPCYQFSFESPPIVTPVSLLRVIRNWKPDIVHAQTSCAHTHLLCSRIFTRGFLLVVSRRTSFGVSNKLSGYFKYRLGADHYIAISEASARTLVEAGVDDKNITVIPSGLDLRVFNRSEHNKVEDKNSDVVVATIGSLEWEKGHTFLIRAAHLVLKRCENVEFRIYGTGRLKESLRRLIKDEGIEEKFIIFDITKPIEDILKEIDIFVLPSLEEGLSTALISAMASGLPVVATTAGGIPEVVEEGCGILVPPCDHEALASAIYRIVQDESMRVEMGKMGMISSRRFDIEETIERTYALYIRLLSGNDVK